ncbi:hypothetical protein AB1K56_06995 [Microbacterium sp. BWR-S6Y]|uniref:PD-(D/E)XK nuclease domain-containing protein n=1 Tax=Microbacterium sp. BWR-S6Y TaxID=3232073 RepID=UPI003527DC6E
MDAQQATQNLSRALARGERVVCIHYSCESFHNVQDRPLAVTAIAITELTDSGDGSRSEVFSVANALSDDDSVAREKDLLARFYEYTTLHPDTHWVHWNMNKPSYGLPAIAARYRYLFGVDAPAAIKEDRLYDLDFMIESTYGSEYARHPKMRSLFTLNGFYMPFFKTGPEEVAALANGDYKACENSTAEKASLIARTLAAFINGSLQTANSVGRMEFAGTKLDAVAVVQVLGERMLLVERELSHRYGNRPTIRITDEFDSQDLFRSMLRIFFENVQPETHTPENSGASARIDFLLPDFELAVELKFVRPSLTDKILGEELIVDRQRYSSMGNIRHLVCLVFDHKGLLRNPRGLENDLSHEASLENFAVTVRIFDR